MKKLRFIYGLMILLVSFTGCGRDEFENFIDVEEGLPAVIKLEYGSNVGNINISTKAGLSGEQEDAIYSIYVMTFDKNGNRTNNGDDALFYRTDTGGGTSDKVWVDESGLGNYSKGYIQFSAQTGTDVKIYAVANVNTPELSGLYSLSSDDLDKVTDLTQLMDLTVGINNAAVSRGSKLMMFGCYKSSATSADPLGVTITGNGTTVQVITAGKIYFERLDAKVEFKVSIATDLASGVEEFELDLHNWRVFNVPFNAHLAMGTTYGDGLAPKTADDPDDGEYLTTFNTSASNQFDNGNSFTFYMLESNLAASTSLSNYNQREEKDKGENGAYILTDNNWTWKYSPEKSPYVQIKGRLSYKQNSESSSETKDHIHADVVYNIHLGDFKTSINDFWTKPNTHYIYNVYVKGVNNITVEVETSNDDNDGIDENQSGAEGNVVIASGGNIHEVDAHYAQFLLPFTYNSTFLDAMGGAGSIDDLTWYVSTPYSEGTYQEGANSDETKHYDDDLLDYQWVEFYISDTETMVTYGDYLKWLENNGRATLSGGEYTKTQPLYIKEFVEELKKWYNYKNGVDGAPQPNIITSTAAGVEQSIYVTVFVNEFYYENGNPLSTTDNDIPAMVRKIVNGDDRYMHILSNVKYSADGSSSITNSAATIIQKPIRSIYNIPDFGNLDGYDLIWGTETISEKYGAEADFGFLYGAINNSSASSTFNGRYNTSILWKNQSWSNRMTIDDNVWTIKNATTASANPAVYACLARNRDENGNGTVDTEEMKWYMAAIDQLQYLYIGENVVHPDAKLLPSSDDFGDANIYKYLSSTYTDNNTQGGAGGYVLWAEEGLSTSGNLNGWSDDPYSASDKGTGYVRRPVRCLRNLGIDDNLGDGMNSLFKNEDNVISPVYMNKDALRTEKWTDATVFHEDRTTINIPYVGGFEYYTSNSTLVSWDATHDELLAAINSGENCPDGYRVPTQRELSLMYISGIRPPSKSYLWTSSYNWYKTQKNNLTYICGATPTTFTATLRDGNNNYTRCIKDVDAANPAGAYSDGGSLTN